MNIFKKTVLILILAAAGGLFSLGAAESLSSADLPEGFQLADESENLILLYKTDTPEIAVLDKRNAFFWSSAFKAPVSETGLGAQWDSRISSLADILYSKPDDENSYFESLPGTEHSVAFGLRGETLVLEIDFTALQIRFSYEISIDDNTMILSIPENSVEEYGPNSLIRLTVLPFWGAASDSENGYIMYPDGSGAIHSFTEEHGEYVQKYEALVYGKSVLDMEEKQSKEVEQALLPVFGIKRDNNAFLAVAAEGDGDMLIDFAPGGYRIPVNRISSSFIYRHKYKIKRSNVVARTTRALNTVVEIYDKERVAGDRSLNYFFLADEQANYSGMASAYRSYLIENNKIRNTGVSETPDFFLGLLMGIREQRILADRIIPMTDFESAKVIVDGLLSRDMQGMTVNLMGWEKKGYGAWPVSVPVNRKIGGFGGLKDFSSYLNDAGCSLFLQWNSIDARRDNGSFSIYGDTVKNPVGLVVSDAMNQKYLISPVKSRKILNDDLIPYLEDTEISGILFEDAGKRLLMDYVDSRRFMRNDSIRNWQSMAGDARETFPSAGVSGGNAYILADTDWLTDIPYKDTGYFFSDRSVPFFQLAVHGLIPYTTALPGNLSWDHQWTVLKWVEYGYSPYYQLTWEDPGLMRKTDYTELYNAEFTKWADTAASVYARIANEMSGLHNLQILNHDALEKQLFRNTYEDGTRVYINYGSDSLNADGITVPPRDFLVVKPEGGAN
ncbi:MAG: DUF5696 domain-containing protein [Spirochaetales bacterium]|nr:DUF5696 domain-containing protein [Spirochaetales bacterium]